MVSLSAMLRRQPRVTTVGDEDMAVRLAAVGGWVQARRATHLKLK